MSIVKPLINVRTWNDYGYRHGPFWEWTVPYTNTGENTNMYDFKSTLEAYTYTLDVPGAVSTEVTRVKQDEIQLKGVRDGRTISHNWLLPEDALFSEAKATYHLGVLKVVVPRKLFKASSLNVQWL